MYVVTNLIQNAIMIDFEVIHKTLTLILEEKKKDLGCDQSKMHNNILKKHQVGKSICHTKITMSKYNSTTCPVILTYSR